MKTTKIKKVLIAMDYDETSQKVAEQGFSMAQAMNAEVLLLHVISEQPAYYTDYSHISEFKVDLENSLEREIKKKFWNAKS